MAFLVAEIDVKIKCWHPWPEFDIINHRGEISGKVYLNGHHTKSAKKV